MICGKCGHENLPSARYCSSCGRRMEARKPNETVLVRVAVGVSAIALSLVAALWFVFWNAQSDRHGGNTEDFPVAQTVLFQEWTGYDTGHVDIIALDKSGSRLWSYTSETYELGQLDVVSEIGLIDNRYYFTENGRVVALDASTGMVLWENKEFGGYMPHWMMHDNILYICGYLGPDFCAIDGDGRTLCRYETFDEDYCWPESIEWENGKIAVHFEIGPEDVHPDFRVFYVDPVTFEFDVK